MKLRAERRLRFRLVF